jgi:hypothetical protein
MMSRDTSWLYQFFSKINKEVHNLIYLVYKIEIISIKIKNPNNLILNDKNKKKSILKRETLKKKTQVNICLLY